MHYFPEQIGNAAFPAFVALVIGVIFPLALAASVAAVFYRIAGSPLRAVGLAAAHGVGAGLICCAVVPFILWASERGIHYTTVDLNFPAGIFCVLIVAILAFFAAVLTVRRTGSHEPTAARPHYFVTSLVIGIALCSILHLGVILVLLFDQLFINNNNPDELQSYESALAWSVLIVWPAFFFPSLIGALMGRFVGWRTDSF